MKKPFTSSRPLFFLLLFFLLTGCEKSAVPMLQKAKNMQKISTDSVFFYLQQIKQPQKLTEEQQGDYCLLLYQATLQKTGEVKDSLLKSAFHHYGQSPETRLQLLKARNDQARSYLYHNQPDSALATARQLFSNPTLNDTLRSELYGICRAAYMQKKAYPQALTAADSCRQLALQAKDTFAYFKSSQVYMSVLEIMEKREEYTREYHALIRLLDPSPRFRFLAYYAFQEMTQSCMRAKDFGKALEYSKQLSSRRHSRYNIPYQLLLQGELHEALQHTDSAKYYYEQTAASASAHLALEANSRLIRLINKKELPEQAYYLQDKENILKENLLLSISTAIDRKEFKEIKLQNELYSLRLNQQKKELWMMGFAIILLLAGLIGLFFYHREKKKRLQQENRLLHQEAELSSLREKEMLMRNKETELREALFRRITFFHKLPSLQTEEEKEQDDNLSNHRITVTAPEWEEVKMAVNDAFDNFANRLQLSYPALNNKDICFCCLVKISVNLQDLSDIYCVSKSAITKRKYRIKKDKLGITDESISLDIFLQSF